MGLLNYSFSYFMSEYWSNTPLYIEKLIPLFDTFLSESYQEADKVVKPFYELIDKYQNTTALSIESMKEYIKENGYEYITNLLSVNEADLKIFIYLLVLVHQLKGSEKGIQVVLSLFQMDAEPEDTQITQWFQELPVARENTFKIDSKVDISKAGDSFFYNFDKFIRKYVYPELLQLRIRYQMKAEKTFIPYTRLKMNYRAYKTLDYTHYVDWTQPTLTANGTLGGDTCAVSASAESPKLLELLIPSNVTTSDTNYTISPTTESSFLQSLNPTNCYPRWQWAYANSNNSGEGYILLNNETVTFAEYSLGTKFDGNYSNRICTAWEVYVTTDHGTTWTLADTQTNQFSGIIEQFYVNTYTLDTPIENVNGFKFIMTASNGSTTYCSIGQIRLYGFKNRTTADAYLAANNNVAQELGWLSSTTLPQTYTYYSSDPLKLNNLNFKNNKLYGKLESLIPANITYTTPEYTVTPIEDSEFLLAFNTNWSPGYPRWQYIAPSSSSVISPPSDILLNNESVNFVKYDISTNYDGNLSDRICTAWEVYVTTDHGTTWTLADTQTNQFTNVSTKDYSCEYELDESIPDVNGFRFIMTANKGTTYCVSIGHIILYGQKLLKSGAITTGELLASNDNTNWSTVAEINNSVVEPNTTWNLALTMATAFKYYKINIETADTTSTSGTTPTGFAQLQITAQKQETIIG